MQIARESKKISNHVFGKVMCILAGIVHVKNSLSKKPANWYFTHGSPSWHSPLAMSLANVQKPLSSYFLFDFLNNNLVYICDNSFRVHTISFQIIEQIFVFFSLFTRGSQ